MWKTCKSECFYKWYFLGFQKCFTPMLTSIIQLFPKINMCTYIPLLYPWKKLLIFSCPFLFGCQLIQRGMRKSHQSSFRERIKFPNGNKFLLLHFRWIEKEENPKLYASLFKCAIVKVVCFFFFWSSTALAAQFLYCLSWTKICFGLVCNFCSAVEILKLFWQPGTS